MSETRKVLPANDSRSLGDVYAHNHNHYPVEVTVRRVAEKLEYYGSVNYALPDSDRLRGALAILEMMRNAGYEQGQRFHVTVVPV